MPNTMPNTVLGGRYQVLDKIGIGGMASVYRGMDQTLKRSVAIKIMLEQYANDPSFAARFKQEAQAAAALSSPYIVNVYDWGKDGDTYYIVMELLRGTDLKTGLKNHGALEPRKVAQIASQICQALTVAHRHDIIHRDIKPQNIMVQPDGNIKVMDFGIARARNSHLTATNSVLGTAHYVSPEQTQGKELGPTSDIYSLGIVMYEAATGKVPFDGDDAISVALKQVNEAPVPPSKLNPKVDANLEAIILKCMAKDPKDRFQSAEELRRALADYLAGRPMPLSMGEATQFVPASPTMRNAVAPGPATQRINRPADQRLSTSGSIGDTQPPQPSRQRHRGLIAAVIIALLAVAGVVGWLIFGSSGQSEPVPNYVSLTRAAAEKAITDSDFFELGDVKEEYSDTVERGIVLSQDPASGTPVGRGTRINLVVSQGQEPAEEVQVPDLKNMTPEEAQAALEAVELKGQVGDSVASDEVDVGRVAEQEPKAGASAKTGDTVTYHLSKGPDAVDVPNVAGYTRADAIRELESAGFTVNVDEVYSSTTSKGYVIDYSPTDAQPKGTAITIQVSLGQEGVSIPNTIGSTEAEATQTLENAGFNVNVAYQYNGNQPRGVVAGYDPAGTAPSGSTVTIIVSLGTQDDGGSGGDTTQSK